MAKAAGPAASLPEPLSFLGSYEPRSVCSSVKEGAGTGTFPAISL